MIWNDLRRLRTALAALLVGSAILFVIGVAIERLPASGGTPSSPIPTATASAEPHAEEGEAGAPHSDEGEEGESGESFFGIDPESPALVGSALALSFGLAWLVWRGHSRAILGLVVIVTLGFAVLDVLELGHQLVEGQVLIALTAAVVALGHLLAAVVAGRLLTMRPADA